MAGGKNYSITELGNLANLGEKGRVMVGETLSMTGCEVSFNSSPAGSFTPFVHAHKLNEEIYIILSGDGMLKVDGDEFEIKEGSVIRVAPAGERAIKAGDKGISYICIQAQVNSLTQATGDDGIGCESKATWM